MLAAIRRYTQWLHTQFPAGLVEKLPEVGEHGTTAVPGLYVVGDLTGIPLLKLSADSGARAVRHIAQDPSFQGGKSPAGVRDLVVVGAGVGGVAAALEARSLGMDVVVLEAAEPFSTIANFPKGKPIYAYPTEMVPAGALRFVAQVKEPLVEELLAQARGLPIETGRAERVVRRDGVLEVERSGQTPIRARRVIVAIGRSGNFRRLGVPGEELGKVSNRLHDPADFAGQRVLVVGGGDSALEAAIALVQAGADVTLSYRGAELSRPKPDNLAQIQALAADPQAPVEVSAPTSERQTTATGAWSREALQRRGTDTSRARLELALGTRVVRIEPEAVVLSGPEGERRLANDAVFAMIGREAPLEFFRRSGVPIRGERTPRFLVTLLLSVMACVFLYHWKKDSWLDVKERFEQRQLFPFNLHALPERCGEPLAGWLRDSRTLVGTAFNSAKDPGFYYSVAYCLLVVVFGIRRIRRRRTPYVRAQTLTLMGVQVVPLFLLPYLLLPWLGSNGWFDPVDGHPTWGSWIGDHFFPQHSYWRAFGLILAWPLFVYNVFDNQPTTAWLVVSLVQTFVIIPLIVWRWGKGAYCGWICSCGALAETLGDTQRHKMPHGPGWNRLNMAGQVILALAFALLGLRIAGWIWPGPPGQPSWAVRAFDLGMYGKLHGHAPEALSWPAYLASGVLNYAYAVDLVLAGIVGVALYFHYSGRMWCRFFCPLAALMHIYARFSRFRIIPDKKKCISCNVCTSVCHQGIDVMNFANKGVPMNDPQCVRCSACVHSCPTGVLEFGHVDASGAVARVDALSASPVRQREASAS